MTNAEEKADVAAENVRHSKFVIPSSLGIRHSSLRACGAFTLVELLVVISIIIVLAGLILGVSSYVQEKGKRSRAEAEIAAISAACESFKADNGVYPQDAATTDVVDSTATSPNYTTYEASTLKLYEFLSGDADHNRVSETKGYMAFKPNQLSPQDPQQNVTAIRDPFGNSYGYSTMKASGGANGYNPTFDLWSTANATDPVKWIKNW